MKSTSAEARSPECTVPGAVDRFHENYLSKKEEEEAQNLTALFEGSSNEYNQVDAIQLEMPAEMRYQGGREVCYPILHYFQAIITICTALSLD